nr:hypothetical protein [Escherichia coli]
MLTDRHLPSERYRSGSVSAPYPEHYCRNGLPTELTNSCHGT